MELQDIRDLSYQELAVFLKEAGEPAFRARQIFDWIYKKGAADFGAMSNLSASLREKLQRKFTLPALKIIHELTSEDQTKKFLFEMSDGQRVETVLIPTENRGTVCVSTQAGCKFGCKFCASGLGGWARNLTPGEILAQVLHAKSVAKAHPVSHIVFMGTGEPLDNYDNLMRAVRVLNAEEGLNIAARRITVSTCGVIPHIVRLAKEGLQIELAVSLHGYNDDSRKVLMPVNKKYPMKDLIPAVRQYIQATKRQVTFEYILIRGVTCTDAAAMELGRLLRGMICKMNLIPYNPVSEFDHEPPGKLEMLAFKTRLSKLGVHATIRMPRGRDVGAACGQLRHASQVSK